eukprot:4763937-Karenia_brevis.AAC.1
MKEPELKPSDIPSGVTVPQAEQSSASVDNNPRPWDNSQHGEFPGNGEEDGDSLPSFEEPGTEGRDPLS